MVDCTDVQSSAEDFDHRLSHDDMAVPQVEYHTTAPKVVEGSLGEQVVEVVEVTQAH